MTTMTAIDPTELARVAGGQTTTSQELAKAMVTIQAQSNYPGSTVSIGHVSPDRKGLMMANGSLSYVKGAQSCTRTFDATYNESTNIAHVNAGAATCVPLTRR